MDELRVICCWTLRFQDWIFASRKFGLVMLGEMLAGVPLKRADKPEMGFAATLMGRANGGLELKPVTIPVMGSSTWKAYPLRSTVLPLWKMSQAKPTRGWKFLLFCA